MKDGSLWWSGQSSYVTVPLGTFFAREGTQRIPYPPLWVCFCRPFFSHSKMPQKKKTKKKVHFCPLFLLFSPVFHCGVLARICDFSVSFQYSVSRTSDSLSCCSGLCACDGVVAVFGHVVALSSRVARKVVFEITVF